MFKSKKVFYLMIVLCCICVFTGIAAVSPANKLSSFYGKYVSKNDDSKFIEFDNLIISKKTAVISFVNIDFPTHDIKNFSQKNVSAKIFKRKAKKLYFSVNVDDKKIVGCFDAEKKQVYLDEIIYTKK